MLQVGDRRNGNQKLSELMGSEDWIVVERLLRRARRTGTLRNKPA